MDGEDFRVLSILVTWLEVHSAWLNADRLTQLVLKHESIRVRLFWSAVAVWLAKDRRFTRNFLLVAPGPEGLIVAERLVRGVAALPSIDGRPVSVSAGIAGFPLDGRTPGELLAVAEKAMHTARQAGGDRVATQVTD